MASFGDQIEASRRTNEAIRALDARVRQAVSQAFLDWDNGIYDAQTIRHRLEAIVRASYRTAAAAGISHIAEQAGIPRWKPRWVPKGALRSQYLDGLLEDVRRNLREYKASERDEPARRRVISRVAHSAGVAATRGQTDALLRSARELVRDGGFIVRKVWLANYLNHTPCPVCHSLNGTEVGLEDEFPAGNSLKIYGDLKGPPRHPRCMCRIVVLIVGVENHDDPGDVQVPDSMTTDEVKSLKQKFFDRVVGWLRKLARFVKKTFGGEEVRLAAPPLPVASESVRFTFSTYLGAVQALLIVLEDARTTNHFYRITGLSPAGILSSGMLLEGDVDDIARQVERIEGSTRASS